MEQITGLDYKIQEMAARIRELRESAGYTPTEMASACGVDVAEYLACEQGRQDLNFTFIYRVALKCRVNVTDIIEGVSPNLQSYALTRAGGAQRVSQAHGMTYYNLAYAFQNRIAEPLYVRSIYDESAQAKDIELTSHAGQECDIVIEGYLKVQVGEHSEVLGPGDSIYYNSETPHGMIAVGGGDCVFYAIVLNPAGEPIPELCGAYIGERGELIVTDVTASDYPPGLDVFPEGAYHLYDYMFFFTNLKENVAMRTAAWSAQHNLYGAAA